MVAILLTARPGFFLAMDLWRLMVPGFYLAGSLLVAALIIAILRRWWRDAEDRPPNPSDEMAHYRRLYEQGTISEEEFKRLRGLLGGELRRTVDRVGPPAPVAPKTNQTSPAEPPNPAPEEPKPPPDGIQPA